MSTATLKKDEVSELKKLNLIKYYELTEKQLEDKQRELNKLQSMIQELNGQISKSRSELNDLYTAIDKAKSDKEEAIKEVKEEKEKIVDYRKSQINQIEKASDSNQKILSKIEEATKISGEKEQSAQSAHSKFMSDKGKFTDKLAKLKESINEAFEKFGKDNA